MIGTKIYEGRYHIKEEIAQGGFAVVYRATEEGRPDPVAVKVGIYHPDEAYAKSIREEARIIQGLDHPGIVKLLPIPRPEKPHVTWAKAIELQGSPPFFVMEYLNGGSLKDYLDHVERLPPQEAAAIGLVIARALHYVHSRGFGHNDLKLQNVVFRAPIQAGQAFDPVLVDFGIATRLKLQIEAGSIDIMSPEQVARIRGRTRDTDSDSELDLRKVDVWGLGVIMYRMLSGRKPFDGYREKTVTTRILNHRPTSLQRLVSISKEFDELIIDGCLAKNPDDRVSLYDLGLKLRELGHAVTASKTAPQKQEKGFLGIFGRA